MHPEFAPVAFIAAFSLLLPLPWHWRARNVATLSLVIWLFVCNIIYAVDAVIWRDNVKIVVPVWCDITTKIIIGASFALPSACLCICIHLEQVSSTRLARTTTTDKRRRQIFEAIMCFALPMLFMVLHYVVQGHRFDIIEEYGCRPTTYFSIPSLFLVWIPPMVLSLAALVFAGLALRHFMLRRISFAAHLDASRSALTTSRYLRLMLMSVLQMIWSMAITSYTLWFNFAAIPLRPWTTWDDVHSEFSRIDLYPAAFAPKLVEDTFYVLWWMVPASTFLFVAFFAFGQDALDEYKKCFVWFRVRVLRQTIDRATGKGSFGSLPMVRSVQKVSASTSPTSSLPPYPSPASIPSTKYLTSLDDFTHDSRSEISHYAASLSYTSKATALGSISDLSPTTDGPPTPTWALSNVPNISIQAPSSPVEPLTPPSHTRAWVNHGPNA